MKHIVFFIPCFASGGAEAFIVNVAERLDRAEYCPEIVALTVERETVYGQRLRNAHIDVTALVENEGLDPVRRYICGYARFAKLLKTKRYQAAIFHFNVAQGEDLPFVWMSERAGVARRIVHSHNSAANCWYKRFGHWVGKLFFGQSATQWLACSAEAAEWLLPKSVLQSGSFSIIKNGISLDRFRFSEDSRTRIRAELGLSRKSTILLNIGRLEEQKNQSELLDAFERIRRKRPEARLVIVGDGSLRDSLKEKADRLLLSDDILWLGRRSDVPDLMCAADAFLLPSAFEGFPFVLVEAQASGLPCFVSEAVSRDCYLTDLVKSCRADAESFSRSVLDGLDDPSAHPRESYGRIILDKGYDISQTASDLKRYYE